MRTPSEPGIAAAPAGGVIGRLMRSKSGPDVDNAPAPPLGQDTTNRKNMLLLIQLRWMAVCGQIVTLLIVQFGLGIALPLAPMAWIIAALVILNLFSLAWLRRHTDVSQRALLSVMLLDVAALTGQLYLTGGATNPFTFLYLLQATLAAVLLEVGWSWVVVAFTCASFAGLIVFHRPLALPAESGDLFALHVQGMLVCFVLDAILLVVFVARITRNLRERDARLAALKQNAAEEDHIVRMGLLASGAAHELGTPLASLSVILHDWRRLGVPANDADRTQEIEEMEAAVQRCKSIVTGILLSAGEARGEAPRVTTVNTFLDELVAEWRASRSSANLVYENEFGADVPIVSDSALKQVIFNVLDNAQEASGPGWVRFAAAREDDTLMLRVIDSGPGFAAEMLQDIGKPYRSTKGRLGGGLGLFLVVNVVRKLGGSVSAANRPEGGAVVTLRLPLTTLTIGAREHVGTEPAGK